MKMQDVLDLIYDAAGEHRLWPAALSAIADMTGSEGGIIFGQSVAAEQVFFDFNGGLNRDCNSVYRDRHMQNAWSVAMDKQPVGHLVLSDDVVALHDLRRSAFYDEVLRPQGIGHNAMIALAAQNDFRVAFNICRSEARGEFVREDREILEELSSHLRRSVTLGFRLTGYMALRDAAFEIVEQLTDGVIMTGPTGQVVYANQAASALEAEGTLMLKPAVSTWSAPHARSLARLVRSVLAKDAGGTMSLPAFDGSRLLTLIVVALRSDEVGVLAQARIRDGACAIFAIDPLRRRKIGTRQLADAYGLTPAEARVATSITSGRTVAASANELGLSANTVKTHLRRVFAKTSTRGQSELGGLLASLGAVKPPEASEESGAGSARS